MTEATNDTTSPVYFSTTVQEVIKVIAVGMVAGIVTVLLTELVARYFVEPLFCRSADDFMVCANGGTIAFNASLLITGVIAVALLARLGIYRPLLIALGTVAALWNIKAYMAGFGWIEYSLWIILFSMVMFSLFFWILRIQKFWLALAGVLMAVVGLRFVLMLQS